MKKNKNAVTFFIILALVLVAIGLMIYPNFQSGPTNLGPFAACLKGKGTTFYGAFWCPHCQNQKGMFGSAVDQLPYVECSTPDAQGQTQACIGKGIKSYPTWVFSDGSQLTGEVALQTLADKSDCSLPAANQK